MATPLLLNANILPHEIWRKIFNHVDDKLTLSLVCKSWLWIVRDQYLYQHSRRLITSGQAYKHLDLNFWPGLKVLTLKVNKDSVPLISGENIFLNTSLEKIIVKSEIDNAKMLFLKERNGGRLLITSRDYYFDVQKTSDFNIRNAYPFQITLRCVMNPESRKFDCPHPGYFKDFQKNLDRVECLEIACGSSEDEHVKEQGSFMTRTQSPSILINAFREITRNAPNLKEIKLSNFSHYHKINVLLWYKMLLQELKKDCPKLKKITFETCPTCRNTHEHFYFPIDDIKPILEIRDFVAVHLIGVVAMEEPAYNFASVKILTLTNCFFHFLWMNESTWDEFPNIEVLEIDGFPRFIKPKAFDHYYKIILQHLAYLPKLKTFKCRISKMVEESLKRNNPGLFYRLQNQAKSKTLLYLQSLLPDREVEIRRAAITYENCLCNDEIEFMEFLMKQKK